MSDAEAQIHLASRYCGVNFVIYVTLYSTHNNHAMKSLKLSSFYFYDQGEHFDTFFYDKTRILLSG